MRKSDIASLYVNVYSGFHPMRKLLNLINLKIPKKYNKTVTNVYVQ